MQSQSSFAETIKLELQVFDLKRELADAQARLELEQQHAALRERCELGRKMKPSFDEMLKLKSEHATYKRAIKWLADNPA